MLEEFIEGWLYLVVFTMMLCVIVGIVYHSVSYFKRPKTLYFLYAKGVNAPIFGMYENDYLIGIFSNIKFAEDMKKECENERKDRKIVIKEVLFY